MCNELKKNRIFLKAHRSHSRFVEKKAKRHSPGVRGTAERLGVNSAFVRGTHLKIPQNSRILTFFYLASKDPASFCNVTNFVVNDSPPMFKRMIGENCDIELIANSFRVFDQNMEKAQNSMKTIENTLKIAPAKYFLPIFHQKNDEKRWKRVALLYKALYHRRAQEIFFLLLRR